MTQALEDAEDATDEPRLDSELVDLLLLRTSTTGISCAWDETAMAVSVSVFSKNLILRLFQICV